MQIVTIIFKYINKDRNLTLLVEQSQSQKCQIVTTAPVHTATHQILPYSTLRTVESVRLKMKVSAHM